MHSSFSVSLIHTICPVRQVDNVVLKGQPLVAHSHCASFHRSVKGCYLLRTARKYVGGMRSSSHDVMVGSIAVKAWFELLVECGDALTLAGNARLELLFFKKSLSVAVDQAGEAVAQETGQ